MKADSIQGFVRKRCGDRWEDFAMWAWGPKFRTAPVSQFAQLWNARHENDLRFNPNKPIEIELQKMIDLWELRDRPGAELSAEEAKEVLQGLAAPSTPTPVTAKASDWWLEFKANAIVLVAIGIGIAILWAVFR